MADDNHVKAAMGGYSLLWTRPPDLPSLGGGPHLITQIKGNTRALWDPHHMQPPASVTSEMGTADSTEPEEEVAFQWDISFLLQLGRSLWPPPALSLVCPRGPA